MMQVIWMMEPFTEHNGGTWVARATTVDWRSQHERFEKHAIQATGDAGDAVVSHGLLWHHCHQSRRGARVAVLINYPRSRFATNCHGPL